MPARKSPTMLATEALEQIARHEKECGLRWAEAHAELKMLAKEQTRAASATASHAARWEKLAWLVVTVTIGAAITTVARGWF